MNHSLLPPFFNRERELAQLDAAWQSVRPQFITIWGRRRVGKSALLSRFAAGKRAIYLYGTRIAEQDLLRNLTLQAATVFGVEYLRRAPFPDWDAALEFLTDQARSERLLIVLDEFPYLCEVTTGLDTLVQRWWDLHGQTANVMLVVAGSAFTFMAGLTGYHGALYGRRTGQLDLHPFDYFDAARFYPHLDPVDRVRAYACFGGIPAYLGYWNGIWSLREAVLNTSLTPGHFLFREGEDLLRTEFHQETLYASILRAVAEAEVRPSDIARAVGRQGVNEIADHLRRLQELRFLRREVPVTEQGRLRSQRVVYRLADPYLRFWFRFVSPYQSSLQLGAGVDVWDDEIAPHLDKFIGRTTWEEACIQYLWRRVAARSLPTRLTDLGCWWDNQDEIDIVGLYERQAVLIGECKWTNSPVDERVLDALQRKAKKLPLAESPLWVIASRSGFEARLRDRARSEHLLLIEPSDLYGAGLSVSAFAGSSPA